MTPQNYADNLVEEYYEIINDNIHPSARYLITIRTAAIKCAIKQVEAQINLTEPGDDNDKDLTESLTYLKSLL